MAAVTATTMMEIHEGKKAIHPFFGKSKSTPTSSGSSTLASVPVNTDSDVPAHRLTESYDESSNLKPTPTRLSPRQPDDLVKPIPGNCSAQQQAEQMEVDMNQSRRKRRRTTLPKVKLEDTPAAEQLSPSSPTRDTPSGEPSENDGTLGVGDVKQPAHAASLLSKQPKDTQTEFQSPTSIVSPRNPPNRCDTLEAVESANLNTIPQQDQNRDEALDIRNIYQKPKKILHFNSKTGTIGSPPAKGSVNAIEGTSTETPPLKNRKRARSLIIGVKYGQNAKERLSIGNKINQIFEHKKLVAVLEKQKTDVKEPPRKVEKSKSTHPFFLGKAALKPSINESSDSSPLSAIKPDKDTPPKSALPSTRAKARSPTRSSFPPAKSNNFPTFGNSNKLLKFPGAVEPIWPPRDMAHVRGPMDCPPRIQPKDISIPISFHEHKSKYTASEATAQEDILQIITAQLAIKEIQEELKNVDTDSYKPPDRCLRLPGRHFESGIKLQCRIKSQIKSTLNSDNFAHDSSEDELAQVNPRSVAHPVVRKIYDSIPHSLSAFDKSEYQTQSWIHKYSPSCAEEVLQSGREAFILKEWLQTLTVLAVDTGMGEGNSSRPTPGLPKQSGSKSEKGGKRKRKSKKLDGFIVSSDDEANDMDEISDLEDDFPRGSQGNKKTLIRRGDAIAKSSKEPSKLLNAVVISGPNGCGKTAAVYAVAKELDFEIFEINSSTRRSGKDILERVGEMTKNHLVQHKQQRINEDDGGLQRASDAAEADLKSGRQGTMKSFFKATAPKAKESNLKPRQDVDQKSKTAGQTSSKKPIKQKQSLILLEEVDILFEEDKQFWVTVLGLIMQSKRPIIMTCNDESVVLNQALPLHAIIRFTPPPLDLAVDYMLLVAANEGHVLQRQAVTALYQAQKYDLRASMTELEFWCQFGVGDRRGGFDWFFPRLPRGVDKDPHGNTIRVVSQDTYKTGMGWLGRDSLCDPFGINDIEDEILRETWDGWQLDAGDWYDTLKLGSWTDKMPMIPVEQRLSALEYYDEFTEALSVADLCACGEFGMDNAMLLDPTTPPISAKALEDLVMGYEFIQADILERQNTLARDVSLSLKSLARAQGEKQTREFHKSKRSKLAPITESQVISQITTSRTATPDHLTRHDHSLAFDPIASIEKPSFQPTNFLDPSCLDRTMAIIATDIAPYIRSIVAYDAHLQQERAKLSNLLSEGGRAGKRMRTTRSAMSALEGGSRRATRRERWFGEKVNAVWVERTGMACWREAVDRQMCEGREGSSERSGEGSE